ncbi:MAG TPA: hypothetical protein PKN56_19075 [Leptospiraceae bacterium]|nr:hypothetical protein [Leptospiraceae bacterium]
MKSNLFFDPGQNSVTAAKAVHTEKDAYHPYHPVCPPYGRKNKQPRGKGDLKKNFPDFSRER